MKVFCVRMVGAKIAPLYNEIIIRWNKPFSKQRAKQATLSVMRTAISSSFPTPSHSQSFYTLENDSKPPSCLFVVNRFKSFGQQISICPVLQSFLCCITHSGFYSWCLYQTSLSLSLLLLFLFFKFEKTHPLCYKPLN